VFFNVEQKQMKWRIVWVILNLFQPLYSPECYFSLIYYKLPENLKNTTTEDPDILRDWLRHVAYGFFNPNAESNATYCLILYHVNPSSINSLELSLGLTMEMNVALIYLTDISISGYFHTCKMYLSLNDMSGGSIMYWSHDLPSTLAYFFSLECTINSIS